MSSTRHSKKVLSAVLTAIIVISIFGGAVSGAGVAVVEEEIDYITIKEAEEIINSQNVVVLDVRSRAEYESGHIAGAKLMPISEFLEDRIDGLDKDKTIIVYCGSGGRSEKASEILVQHGFKNVYNMLGGITAWIDAGLPTTSFLNTQTFMPNNNSLSFEIDDVLDDKPVFVFFYADWCHFCHQQMPIINELEQEYAGRLDFIYIDINEKQDFASEFRVNGVPTMFIISGEDEQFIKEISGFTSKTRLKEIIDLEIGQNEVDNNEILISALSRDLGIFLGSYKNLLILTLVLFLFAVLVCFFSNLFKNFFKKLGYKKEGLAKLLLIFLIVGVLITSFVYAPSVFAGGPLIHDYIADETAKKIPQIHSSGTSPSDRIFRNGAVMGDLGFVFSRPYITFPPWTKWDAEEIMTSTNFSDILFYKYSNTSEEKAWAAGIICHNEADLKWSWTGPTSIHHPPGYIQDAGIYKYWGTGEIRECYFKLMNDLAVKEYTGYSPFVSYHYYYEPFKKAYEGAGGKYPITDYDMKWAVRKLMLAHNIEFEALGKVPYKLLVPKPDWTDLIVVLFPFIKYQLDHPCVTCAGTCWPWPCCDLKFTTDNWNYLPDGSKGYVPKSVDASTEALIELYRERPQVTKADFRPIVMNIKAEKSERPYAGEDLWPHVYAYTENIGTQSEYNVWSSYNFSGEAEYDRSSKCPGDEVFKGDVCWKRLSSSTESLINDPENQYHCIGFMSQNWEEDNDDMVGLRCIAYRDGNIWKGKLKRDCKDCDNAESECTFLCFNKKTIGAGECSESFKGDICWKQKTAEKETGKEGKKPKRVSLVKFDPDNKYKCIGFMSQNWEKDNDDMVGLGCTIEREYIHKGVLAKDWHCAETGPGQCTYLCLSGKVLGRYNKEEDIPGCLGRLFIYDNIVAEGPGSPPPEILLNDPNEQYQCLAFMSQNWDNIPETKGKKNDEFVGLKCLAYRDGDNWMKKLEKGGKDSELERSECTFLCINKQWNKCYSDPSIPVGEKGETVRAFFPASPGKVTFGMYSDSKILEDGIPPGGFEEQPYPAAEMNNYAEYSFDWDPDLKTTSIEVEPSRYGYVEVGDCVKIKANFSSSKPNVNIHAKFYIDGIEIADVPVKFGSQLKIEKEVTWLSDCAGDIDGWVDIINLTGRSCGEHKIKVVINPFPEPDNFGNPNKYVEKNISNNVKEITIGMVITDFYIKEVPIIEIIDKPEDKINITDINEKQAEIANWTEMSKFGVAAGLIDSGITEFIEEGNTGRINITNETAYCEVLRNYSYNLSEAIMKMYVLEKKRWELENVVVNETSPACAYGKAYFSSIQEAIDWEMTKPNNTIIVCNGTYEENVKVHKPVRIVGIDQSNTIVKGVNPNLPVFYGTNDSITIKGLTIEGHSDSASPGIYFREARFGEIRDNIIKNNKIGIYLPGSSNNIITRNKVISNYYGVGYLNGPNLIYDNIFNNAENYYLILAHNYWNVTKMEIGYGGRNIVGDYYLGGNYWAKPDGTGFSQTCYDLDGDGFCDEPYTLDPNNIDYLPLKDCSCESCEDCMDKLNDPTCKFVKLTWSINSTGTCIDNPPGFFNKTLDCKEHGIKGDGNGYGIYFSNNNNTIKNCLISNFSDAIRLENSNLNVLEENVFLNNTFGIHLYTSLNNSITKNIFRDNWHGIDVYSSSQNNNITFNILNSNEVGIIDVRSGKNRIIDNYVNNSSYDGIILYWNSDYSNVENNTVENSNHGITVRASRFDRIRGNVLNLNNISIALVPRTPAERTSDIIVEENLILDSSKYGLYLESTSSNNLIDNSILNYNTGIYLNLSSSNNIANNTVSCEEFTVPLIGASPRRGNAIELWKSSWNNITGNILSSNYDGIQLMDSSNHNAVLDNIVESSDHAGICLNKGWLDLNPVMYNNITNNIVHHNYEGISLYEYDHGLCRCDYNSIHGNEIFNNRYGIKISQSGGNEIKDNIVYTNEYGINIEGTYCEFNGGCYNSNTIYNNIFDNSINAYDSGCDIWNIQKTPRTNIIDGPFLGGNYWSDYTGIDNNYDGLGDTLLPYNCGGNIVSSGDWNPLVEIKIPPEFIVARINNSIYYFPYNENTNVFGSPVQIDTLGPCTGSPKIDGRVVDFDNDGDYDVLIDTATWYSAGPMFRVYENTGTDFVFRYGCSFGIPDFGDSWGDNSFVVAGDFDEDGDWEFIGSIIREFAPYTYEIKFKRWENLGDFSFNLLYDLPLDVSQIEHPHDIESADFNNDGHLDLLISDYPNGGIHNGKAYLYTGNGAWGFTPVTNNPVISIPNQPIPAIVAGDFVGGWSVDVIAGLDDDGDPGQAFLFKNDGTGVFTQTPVTGGCMPGVWNGHEPFDVNRQNEPDQYDKPGAGVMDAKDFDKNGRLDIVTSFTGPTDISSWPHPLCRINGCPPSSPKGTFYAATTVHPEAYLIAAPDVTVLCACEEALYGGNVSNPEEKINSLRELRDEFLRDKYVYLYYEYNPEIRRILIGEPYLLIGAANLLVKYIPAVNYVTGRDGADLKIEEKDVKEAIPFIENLKGEIWERREEIGINRSSNIIEFLEEFEKQVNASEGKTFSQAFRDSIYARWPVNETEYKNSITQPIDVSKIRYKFTAVDEEWAAKWTNLLLYGQKETKYSIEIYLNETGYVTRVDFGRWGFPITEIPYDLAKQSLASLPPGFALDP